MFWRVCLVLLMNVSSQMEEAQKGMLHSNPSMKSPALCVQVVCITGEEGPHFREHRLFPNIISLLFGFVAARNNWILTGSLTVWYLREIKFNQYLFSKHLILGFLKPSLWRLLLGWNFIWNIKLKGLQISMFYHVAWGF